MSKTGGTWFIGILYFFLGQYDTCVATLAQAEQEAIGGPIEEHIRQLRARVQGFVSDPWQKNCFSIVSGQMLDKDGIYLARV